MDQPLLARYSLRRFSRPNSFPPIPHGTRTFEIKFDFIDHQLRIDTSDGERRTIELKPRSVADFYRAVAKSLDELRLPVTINKVPNEIENPIPFDEDENTVLTTESFPIASGASFSRATASSRSSARVFAANAVRCISSGAALIWQ